jgi:chromosomal replication initiation ATPase DnaA
MIVSTLEVFSFCYIILLLWLLELENQYFTRMALDIIALKTRLIKKPKQINRPSLIISAVSSCTGVAAEDIIGPIKKREIVEARQLSIWLILHFEPKMTHREVGAIFSKDRTMVIYSRKQVENLMDTDKSFQRKFDLVINYLKKERAIA